jgi:hypothetical protein
MIVSPSDQADYHPSATIRLRFFSGFSYADLVTFRSIEVVKIEAAGKNRRKELQTTKYPQHR